LDNHLQKKLAELKRIVSGYGKVAVAFSGGVDSALLLKISVDLLGKSSCVALFCNSNLQPASVLEEVRALADLIGSELFVVDSDILSERTFCLNSVDRCYICKQKTYHLFLEKVKEFGYTELLDGTNLDDDDAFRPGSKAVSELGVKTPLREVGLTKKDIRLISKFYKLPTWHKFSASCLATRVETDQEITLQKLDVINRMEQILNDHNFQGCRLRHCGSFVVIKLVKGDHIRFVSTQIFKKIKKYLKKEGIEEVFLDLSEREGILL
jgi:uncharacterized protein